MTHTYVYTTTKPTTTNNKQTTTSNEQQQTTTTQTLNQQSVNNRSTISQTSINNQSTMYMDTCKCIYIGLGHHQGQPQQVQVRHLRQQARQLVRFLHEVAGTITHSCLYLFDFID